MSKLDLLKQLYGDVLVSMCHKDKLCVIHANSMSYYICKKCNKPCEAISLKAIGESGVDVEC